MRALAAIILTSMFAAASAADPLVVVVRDGRNIVVADSVTLAAKVIALAESCSVNSTDYAAPMEAWPGITTSRSYVRVVFSEPRKTSLVQSGNPLRSELPVQEVRLPLPHGAWPAHVFVSSGRAMLALTKCDPFALRELVLLEELELATLAPYNSLIRLKPR